MALSTSDIEDNRLPRGWTITTIGNICNLLTGYGFPIHLQGKIEGDLPFLKVGDISEAWLEGRIYLTKANHYITFQEAEQLKAKAIPKGTVVFAKVGAAIALNRRAIIDQPSLVDNNVMGIWADPQYVDLKYLFYFACTLKFGDSSRASIVPSIRQSDVADICFYLPPFNEQKRIVAKIEELFSKLDAGITALKRVQANLKRYRAAVLKAAVEGKLTEEWRNQNPNTEPASKLLQRILKERRQKWESDQIEKYQKSGKTPKKDWQSKYKEPSAPDTANLPSLPDGWCWASIDQISEVQGGIQKQPSRTPQNNAYPYLRVANVYRDRLDLSEVHLMELYGNELDKLRLQKDDLLIVEGNGSRSEIGRSALWLGEIENCVHQNHIIRVRFLAGKSGYLNLYWNSPEGTKKISEKAASTSGLYTLSVSKITSISVPLPPLSEQSEIINIADNLTSLISQTELSIQKDKIRASRLRQSILKQAFSGKLVPQDPNDEPASVLLQRIKNLRKQENTQTRVKSTMNTKSKLQSKEPKVKRSIYETLLETNNSLSPEELFTSAGFGNDTEEVEEFYEELRTEINNERIIEERHGNERVTLQVKKA